LAVPWASCCAILVLLRCGGVIGRSPENDFSVESDEVIEIVEGYEDSQGRVEPGNEYESLEEIVEIVPIDEELAKKMIEKSKSRKESMHKDKNEDYEESDDDDEKTKNNDQQKNNDDLETKAQRLYDLFNIDDLDDIINVIPIKSMQKLKGYGREGSDDYEESKKPPTMKSDREDSAGLSASDLYDDDSSYEQPDYDDYVPDKYQPKYKPHNNLNRINRKIDQLESLLNNDFNKLNDLRGNLGSERNLLQLLNKMINLQRKKLMTLIKVRRDHMKRAAHIGQNARRLKNEIKHIKDEKDQTIDSLQQEVQMEKQEENKLLREMMNSNAVDEYDGYNDDDSNRRIVKRKHRIQSITDITSDEAKELRSWLKKGY